MQPKLLFWKVMSVGTGASQGRRLRTRPQEPLNPDPSRKHRPLLHLLSSPEDLGGDDQAGPSVEQKRRAVTGHGRGGGVSSVFMEGTEHPSPLGPRGVKQVSLDHSMFVVCEPRDSRGCK